MFTEIQLTLKRDLRILLIDDVMSTKETVEEFLSHGFQANIDVYCPSQKNIKSWLQSENFPKASDLDKYDFAFVDLELDPDCPPQNYDGGIEVLPYLKRNAPWLPVVGYSKHYDGGEPGQYNPILNAKAGTFAYDIGIPRSVLKYDPVSYRNIESWLISARINCLVHCMGQYPDHFNNPSVALSDSLKEQLNILSKNYQELLKIFFCFSKKIIIEKYTHGHSGSIVLKVYSDVAEEHLYEENIYIIKINKSPSKLNKELRHHQLMTRKGLSHASFVPLIWPNVISDGTFAIIGYQFAKSYSPLSEKINTEESLTEVLYHLKASFSDFYKNTSNDRALLREIIKSSVGKINESILSNINGLNSDLKNLVENYIKEKPDTLLDKAYSFTACLIHGDLHSDNIMVKEKDVLFIDFAFSKKGPLVYDLVKLYIDISIRMIQVMDEHIEKIMCGEESEGMINNLLEMFNMKSTINDNENRSILRILAIFQVVKFLEYTKEDDIVNRWLQSKLQNVKKI